MFTIETDKTINVTRGDILYFTVSAQDKDTKEVHTFQPGDIVRISIFGKKECENVVVEKDFLVETPTEEVLIYLDKKDTTIGEVINKPAVYWYNVKLNPDEKPQTIIGYDEEGARIFRLYPTGEEIPAEDEEVKPEDIPVIDDELDTYSNRPVRNKAIAKAVISLDSAIGNTEREIDRLEKEAYEVCNQLRGEISVERARITNLAKLGEGSTTGDAELIDLRVGADGNIYKNAGESVRSQFEAIRDDLKKSMCDIQTFRLYGNFVNATLNSGVLNTNYKYRASTDTIMCFDKDIIFKIADGFRLAIHEFKDGVFFADWGWRTSSVKVNEGVNFKCMIARSTDDTSEVADVNEFTNAITFDTNSLEVKKATTQSLYAVDNVKARYTFETGDIKTDTGKDFDANLHRIRTKGVCYTPNDIVIVANGLYRVYVYTFDDENYTNASAEGWVMSGYENYTIPAGTYFRLLLGHIDDQFVSYDEIEDVKTSDLYNNLEIYTKTKVEHEKNMFYPTVQKSNIESVAHQGFSTTSQYYGNCRLSAVNGAYMKGFDYTEIDVQFAADGVPVCCHDATFTDTNNGTVITLANHTAEELKAFGYYGETIATLEEIVSECKRLGVGLYIDKVENINTDVKWSNVFGILKKYAMENKVVWLSYNEQIHNWNSKARFALVVHSMNDGWINQAKSIADKGHEVYLNVNHAACSVEQIMEYNAKLPANISIGVWTIDDMATYEAYKPYVCAITSNKISDGMTNKKGVIV